MMRDAMMRHSIRNASIGVLLDLEPEGVLEHYFILRANEPVTVAVNHLRGGVGATALAAQTDSGDRSHVAPDYGGIVKRIVSGELKWEDFPPEPVAGPATPVCPILHERHELRHLPGDVQEVTFFGRTAEGDRVARQMTLCPCDNFFRVEVTLSSERPLLLEHFEDRFCFGAGGAPDFTWTPQLKMTEDNVFPDYSWKAPAAIVQKGPLAVALVPDIAAFSIDNTWRRCSWALDLDTRPGSGPELGVGLTPVVPHLHSLFKHVPGQCVPLEPGCFRFAYYLLLFDGLPEREAHRPVVRFLWQRFGRGALLEGHAAQGHTFAEWAKKTWREYGDQVWLEVNRSGVSCGMMKCGVFFPIDAWFCAWWNNMRTAYGLALYARRAGDAEARERAGKMLNMALDAPRRRGAFPVLFTITDAEGARWRRDHSFGGIEECYHAFDMAWTGYWLLKWHTDIDPADERIVPVCRALGDFLLRHQEESGFIPSYFKEDFVLKENCRLNRESAEPAGCAVFLVELHKTVHGEKYLTAAVKAMEYVQGEIVPERKWFDYETFLSCSPKPYSCYDPITMQHPQNNMGTIQAAMGFLGLYDATGQKRYLEWGMNVLDYLSLTQQVWSHPMMTPNLIGGFTTQNSDAEWSDARQAYCALVYLDYFERTGRLEYLERGIAALRSSFAVAPYENWAHGGYYDLPGALSGFHWGQGSAMASVEMVRERCGDVLADLQAGWAYGINGCTVDAMESEGTTIRLAISTALKWGEPARVVFRNVPSGRYDLWVNSRHVGAFEAAALVLGVCINLKG